VVVFINNPVANDPRANSLLSVPSAVFVRDPAVVGAPVPAPGHAPYAHAPDDVSKQSPSAPVGGRPDPLTLAAQDGDARANSKTSEASRRVIGFPPCKTP
jgi:hypothetical protein